MPKIAMIGAGSLVFCKTLVSDMLATPALQGSEIRLMNRTRPKLDGMHDFVKRMIADNGLAATVSATLDRREALAGADYVVVMVQVGGLEAFGHDYEIPMRYGIDQCIGDSLGPGGVFRGIRTIPLLLDIARDMRELCPEALLLNYANPMGLCCTALGRYAQVQYIGLCHGVQTTLDLISRYVNVAKDQIEYFCAGINHMAWFLELRDKRTGADLNPILRECMEKPEYYGNEKVRAEVMRHFGYFMTESSGHLSEYIPWFRGSERGMKTYCDEPGFGGETGAYYSFSKMIADKYSGINYLDLESTDISRRSVEYCSYILEAKETGQPFRLNGNVRNDGYITNLPDGCCVEVPVFVDERGFHPVRVADLPPQCAALNQSNVTVQALGAEAAVSGDPELLMQAVAMDPLTSAVCTLAEVRAMVTEMLAAEKAWLPQFDGRTPRPTPPVANVPEANRVDVPVDPALAIANRFGKLATQSVD